MQRYKPLPFDPTNERQTPLWQLAENGFHIPPELLPDHLKPILLIHESPLTDALFLLVSKSDEVTTT